MNKFTFVMVTVATGLGAGALGLAGAVYADDLRPQRHVEPVTLAYPVIPDRTHAAVMIGHAVEDISGNKVGEIEGVHIGKDGKVADVVVGIGGFLGVGQRDVLLKWPSLRIVKGGDSAGAIDKIVVSATKDQLTSMTAYRFDRPDQRRTVFDAPM